MLRLLKRSDKCKGMQMQKANVHCHKNVMNLKKKKKKKKKKLMMMMMMMMMKMVKNCAKGQKKKKKQVNEMNAGSKIQMWMRRKRMEKPVLATD